MKIIDVLDAHTGETRTDGRYQRLIGSTVELYSKPEIGMHMYLSYIADNNGNPNSVVLRTSTVQNIIDTGTVLAVYTCNSVYYFEKDEKHR